MARAGAASPEPCSARPICAVSCGFWRGSSPFSSTAAMRNFGRLFQLRPLRPAGGSLPHAAITATSTAHWAAARRRAGRRSVVPGSATRAASRGRRKHAQRQQRYRRRRLDQTSENEAGGQKVTHHPLTRERRRPVVPQTPTRRRGTRPFGDERLAGVFRCHRCGRFCARFIYPGLRPVRRPAREG